MANNTPTVFVTSRDLSKTGRKRLPLSSLGLTVPPVFRDTVPARAVSATQPLQTPATDANKQRRVIPC